eukprot:3350816-Pleurochrysis_carterae.AAC.1
MRAKRQSSRDTDTGRETGIGKVQKAGEEGRERMWCIAESIAQLKGAKRSPVGKSMRARGKHDMEQALGRVYVFLFIAYTRPNAGMKASI